MASLAQHKRQGTAKRFTLVIIYTACGIFAMKYHVSKGWPPLFGTRVRAYIGGIKSAMNKYSTVISEEL